MNQVTLSFILSRKASLWTRAFAFVIDAIIIGTISTIVWLIFQLSNSSSQIFNLILFYTYNIIMDYCFKGTIGKIYMNIMVVGSNGRAPHLLKAVLRNLGRILSSIPLGYGYFRILAPHIKQTFHDQMSGCYVVER